MGKIIPLKIFIIGVVNMHFMHLRIQNSDYLTLIQKSLFILLHLQYPYLSGVQLCLILIPIYLVLGK